MANKGASRAVLIFGGAGFIGSNWARRLLEDGEAHVQVFDNLSRPGSLHNLEMLRDIAGRSGRFDFTEADVRDRARVQAAVRHATEIYNFAAQVAVTTSIADPRLDFEINMGGTFNILEAARLSPHRPSLLFTSTNKVYGEICPGDVGIEGKRYVPPAGSAPGVSESQAVDFHSPYGCSKGAADQYVRDFARIYGLSTTVFRMSCIAGPGQFGNEDQGWVAHFVYSALLGRPVTLYGTGMQVRDVLYIEDLLDAFEAVHQRRTAAHGQIYNVGGGLANTTSLLELIDRIAAVTGMRLNCRMKKARPGDQLIYVTDHSKLTRDTGWRPRAGLEVVVQGLRRWFDQHREALASAAHLAPAGLPSVALARLEPIA